MSVNPEHPLMALSSELESLTSEESNQASSLLDTMSPLEIATLMNQQDAQVSAAVEHTIPEISKAIEYATKSMDNQGRLIYVGAGTSGRLGILDASEIPPTFSMPAGRVIALIAGGKGAMFKAKEGIEDRPEQGRDDMANLHPDHRDTVVGLAASGRTPYVLGALAEARKSGAKTISISCNKNSILGRDADVDICPLVGPEILTGSTRLKSGTAQKMILNMISTGAMVRIGKCYGNRMVDLNASNDKLRARALNLVSDIADVNKDKARQALQNTDWDIKAAILVAAKAQSPNAALALIAENGGQLRKAMAAASKSNSTK